MMQKTNIAVKQNGSGLQRARGEYEAGFLTPTTDIYETPDAFVVALDMPGAARESISLSLQQGTMVVKADVDSLQSREASMLCTEIVAPGYYRSFKIGEGIDENNVDASYDLGVLTVKLLKNEQARPREIRIR